MRRASRSPVLVATVAGLVAATALGGCGGDDATTEARGPATTGAAPPTTAPAPSTGPRTAPTTTEAAPSSGRAQRPSAQAIKRYRALPRLTLVPQTGGGAPDQQTTRIAERWFALVRANRPVQAADLMVDGARFSNLETVGLATRQGRIAAADGLPCGAEPTDVSGSTRGYVVLQLKLVDRAGSPPCDGAGAPVAVSIHVTDGKIDDWVRVGASDAPINRGTPI